MARHQRQRNPRTKPHVTWEPLLPNTSNPWFSWQSNGTPSFPLSQGSPQATYTLMGKRHTPATENPTSPPSHP